jgi:hypothetical protein
VTHDMTKVEERDARLLRGEMDTSGGVERFARWARWGWLRRLGIALSLPLAVAFFAVLSLAIAWLWLHETLTDDAAKCRRIRRALALTGSADGARGTGAKGEPR